MMAMAISWLQPRFLPVVHGHRWRPNCGPNVLGCNVNVLCLFFFFYFLFFFCFVYWSLQCLCRGCLMCHFSIYKTRIICMYMPRARYIRKTLVTQILVLYTEDIVCWTAPTEWRLNALWYTAAVLWPGVVTSNKRWWLRQKGHRARLSIRAAL